MRAGARVYVFTLFVRACVSIPVFLFVCFGTPLCVCFDVRVCLSRYLCVHVHVYPFLCVCVRLHRS